MRSRPGNHQDGVTLLEVLIATGITAVVAMLAMKTYTNGMKAQQHIDLRTDLAAVKNTVMSSVSCKQTVGPIATTCNGVVPLLRVDGSQMQTAGKYTLRATCQAGQGLEVQAARLKPGAAISTENNADFYTDPLTGQPLSWKNGVLFAFSDGLCGKLATALTTTPTGGSGCNPKNVPCVNTPNYLIQTGDLVMHPSLPHCYMDSPNVYNIHASGIATCPTGWRPSGFSANCQFTLNTWEGGADVLGTQAGGGMELTYQYTPDSQGANFDCCVAVYSPRVTNPIAEGYLAPSGQGAVQVACVPETPASSN